MYYMLLYDYVEDVVERRPPFRNEHLGLLNSLHERGIVPLAGAYDDPVDSAAFVFRVDDPAEIEAFVAADPYVRNGLVTSWRIRRWNVVIGANETW